MFPSVTPSQYYFFSEGGSLSISTPVPGRPAVPRGGDGSAGQGLPEASAGWCDSTERKGGAKGTYSSHLRQGKPSLICKAIQFFEPSQYNEHFVFLQFLQRLPWENIACLKSRSVTRMPSLHAVLGHGHLKEVYNLLSTSTTRAE